MSRPPFNHKAPAGTSDVAADMIADFAPTQQARVEAFVRSRRWHGATNSEVQIALGMLMQSVCPCTNALVRRGLLVDSGRRRKTPSGRPAAVWIAAEFAEQNDEVAQ